MNAILCERLTELRGEKSLKDVADAIGINRATLGYYEQGKRKPDAEILADIANYYNVSVDYLLGISDAKSYDIDIQAISQKTGLSERAVIILLSLKINEEKEELELLNALLSYMPEELLSLMIYYRNSFLDIHRGALVNKKISGSPAVLPFENLEDITLGAFEDVENDDGRGAVMKLSPKLIQNALLQEIGDHIKEIPM